MSKTRKIFWPAAQSSQLLEFVAREKNFSGIYINLLTFLGARPIGAVCRVRGSPRGARVRWRVRAPGLNTRDTAPRAEAGPRCRGTSSSLRPLITRITTVLLTYPHPDRAATGLISSTELISTPHSTHSHLPASPPERRCCDWDPSGQPSDPRYTHCTLRLHAAGTALRPRRRRRPGC